MFFFQAEDEIRKRRLEEQELRECTFKPRMNWKASKSPGVQRDDAANGEQMVRRSIQRLVLSSDDSSDGKSSATTNNEGYSTPPQVSIFRVSPEDIISSDRTREKCDVKKSLGNRFEAVARSEDDESSADTEYGSI